MRALPYCREPTSTQDIDLWFEELGAPEDRLDVVTHMHGLGSFTDEWAHSYDVTIDGVPLRVLGLERIIHSKRAAARKKDLAAIPALEEALAVLKAQGR